MLIRMTGFGTLVALFAAGTVAIGGVLGTESNGANGSAARTALVMDAAAARDGRDLIDDRLRAIDAELRLPRTAAEARTNVRYFDAQDYRVVVAGPLTAAAADATGVPAVRAPDLTGAVAAVGR
jgi:hypothetical protein